MTRMNRVEPLVTIHSFRQAATPCGQRPGSTYTIPSETSTAVTQSGEGWCMFGGLLDQVGDGPVAGSHA